MSRGREIPDDCPPEAQTKRVQKRPRRKKSAPESRRILPVDEDRVPDFRQMNADLMRPSRKGAAE